MWLIVTNPNACDNKCIATALTNFACNKWFKTYLRNNKMFVITDLLIFIQCGFTFWLTPLDLFTFMTIHSLKSDFANFCVKSYLTNSHKRKISLITSDQMIVSFWLLLQALNLMTNNKCFKMIYVIIKCSWSQICWYSFNVVLLSD